MSALGHKLTIKGEGLNPEGYKFHLDDREIIATTIDVHYEVDAPITATITLYINELDVAADIAPGLVTTQ